MPARAATFPPRARPRAKILTAALACAGFGVHPAAASVVRQDDARQAARLGMALGQTGLRDALDPSQLCRAAITATERMTGIPDAFLSAIGRVESGREDGGARHPWPWTVNAAGEGHFYPTKQAAIDAVRQFLAAGVKSLDIGCLQVNILFHPDAFPRLDQAFDPAANAAYAGRLLQDLFRSTGSWPRAAAAYHSMTPALGAAYLQRVLEEWALPDRGALAGREDGDGQDVGKPRTRANEVPALTALPAPSQSGVTAPPPAFGFSRRFMLAQGAAPAGMATGRSLAAYRAVPVRVAMRQIQPLR